MSFVFKKKNMNIKLIPVKSSEWHKPET